MTACNQADTCMFDRTCPHYDEGCYAHRPDPAAEQLADSISDDLATLAQHAQTEARHQALAAFDPAPAGAVEPVLAGTFALYPTPAGGLMLVTEVPGRGTERREIPAAVVKMVSGGGGPMGGMLRRMFGQ